MADSGWYEDPNDNSILRWWDGNQWTAEVSPNPNTTPPQPQQFLQQPQQPQQPQQLAPWEQQPAIQTQYQPAQYQPEQYQPEQSQPAQNDEYTPPPWIEQNAGAAPWETRQVAPDQFAELGRVDPYAPQVNTGGAVGGNPWDTNASTSSNYNPLSGYEMGENDGVSGRSMYGLPDDDEENTGRGLPSFLQGPKRFIVIGGAALLVLVLFMGVRSFLGGGDEAPGGNGAEQAEGATGGESGETEGGGGVTPPEQTSDTGVPIVQIPAWSKWPSITLGYVIEYPKAPELSSGNDRQVFTTQQDGAQYQLTILNVDSATIAAFSGAERIGLARTLIVEQNPDAPAEQLENLTEASLGGLPARQAEWDKADGTKVVARFTFTKNRVYLLTGSGPDTQRFLDSFGWFREPPAL